MRRAFLALVVLPLALGSAGCLRWLDPDFECDDECFVGQTGCADDATSQFCIIEPLFGCMIWVSDENCAERNAWCMDGECACAWGSAMCVQDGPCVDLWANRWNCGACGVVCAAEEACVEGVCRR